MTKRRLLQPPNNAGQHHAAIPVGVSQTPGTLAGRQPRAAWIVAARREPRRDALGEQLGQAVVSLERKMHVLVKRLAPGDAAWLCASSAAWASMKVTLPDPAWPSAWVIAFSFESARKRSASKSRART